MAATRIGKLAFKLTRLPAPGWLSANDSHPALSEVIDSVRQRWRMRLLLTGCCWILALGVAVIVLAAWLLNYWHFSDTAVWSLRLVTFAGIAGLLLHFFIKPLKRRVSHSEVALYLEEHEPKLKSLILTAVDASRSSSNDRSVQLVNRLVEQARTACEQVEFGRGVERQRLQRETGKLGLALVFILGLLVYSPEFLRNGVPVLLMPWANSDQFSPYWIDLSPGDVEIARGGDQLVSASVVGFDVDQAILYASYDTGQSWRQMTMTPGSTAGLHEYFFFDLKKDIDYFVRAQGLQSPTFHIAVVDIPAISDINLRYHFPAYTLLAPELTRGSGDITALRGTRVEVQIKPSIEIPGGELVLENGQKIDLVQGDDEYWTGTILVDESTHYTVALQRKSGLLVKASSEYRIQALDDRHPSVSIRSPGRDTKASAIEEAILKVRARDDQGIAGLEVVFSVNGDDEQTISLMPGQQSQTQTQQIDAEHTVYLEDLELQPGDLISYYVRARDLAPVNQSRDATSDLFFYQIRPFKTDYNRSEQQSGGGGGGGGQGNQQEGFLAEQQKQFVVATFKMIRDRDKFSAQTYQENLELLATAQSRIRNRVEAIVRRIGSRAMLPKDKAYQTIAEELPRAVEAMTRVEQQLSQREIKAALSDAQVALQHLQRADAAFRKINIALNNGGSGQANNANIDDLANLFKLEMDKIRNQYETLQRGQQQSEAEQIDETLDRLRELARRQQQEVEQRMRRQDQAFNNPSSEKELALARELEAMARQLERLSRKQQNPQLQQSISQMKAAAEAMRRAAAATASDSTGGIGQARQAVERLRDAQRLLDQSRTRQYSDEIRRALEHAEQVEQKQADIKQQVFELEKDSTEAFKAHLSEIENNKQDLSSELDKLEGELNDLTTSAQEQQPESDKSIKQAIRTTHDYRLHDRIQRSKDLLLLSQKKHAIDNEIEIQKGIAEAREHIQTALDNAGVPGSRGLQQSLDQMRSMARELRLMRERGSNSAANQGSASGDASQLSNGGFARSLEEMAGISAQAAALKQQLITQGISTGDIDPVLAKINQLSQAQNDLDGTAQSKLSDQAISALMELEYQIRRNYSPAEFPELLISESQNLPEGYQDMVADYYRKLSAVE